MADVEVAAPPPADEVNPAAAANGEANQAESETTATQEQNNAETDTQDAPVNGKDASGEEEKSGSPSSERKRKDPPTSKTSYSHSGPKHYKSNNHSSNIKTRFDDQPESNDPDEIRAQVEFYFSDSNLPVDAFLLKQTGGHANHPVELKKIHSFKRMRHFQPYSAVRDALRSSKFLHLDDTDNKDELTRIVPLDSKFTDDPNRNRSLVSSNSLARSIYAKGFGDEKASTQLDIEALFQPYGPIRSVRLRRDEDDNFKGSVFVEFDHVDTQKRFLDLETKPQWEDKDLNIMSKQEYVDMKHQGILEGTVKAQTQTRQWGDRRDNSKRGGKFDKRRGDFQDRRGGRGGRGDRRGGFDKDDWKNRRDRDQGRDRRGGRDGGRRGGRDSRDQKHDRDDETESREKEDVPSRAEAEASRSETAATEAPKDAASDVQQSKKRAADEKEADGPAETKKAKQDDA